MINSLNYLEGRVGGCKGSQNRRQEHGVGSCLYLSLHEDPNGEGWGVSRGLYKVCHGEVSGGQRSARPAVRQL